MCCVQQEEVSGGGAGRDPPPVLEGPAGNDQGLPAGSMLRDLPLLDLPQPQDRVEKVHVA